MSTPRYPTNRGRQFFLAGVITVFVIISTAMLLSTAGWVWSHAAGRFIRLSSLYISSSPRADIYLNGQKLGATPSRLFRLAPGNYQVTLKRAGYIDWQTTKQLTAGRASSLPDVRLFPTLHAKQVLTIANNTKTVIDDKGNRTWVILKENSQYKIISGHELVPDYFSLNYSPLTILSGSHDKYLLAQNDQSATMVTIDHSAPNWSIPLITNPVWSSETESTIFGIHDRQLLKIDYLHKTIDYIGPATSLKNSGRLLWYTTFNDGRTSFWRRDESTTAVGTMVRQLDGNWMLVDNFSNSSILKNTANDEAIMISGSLATGFSGLSVGKVNATFNGYPFIWQGATDIKVVKNGRPLLIDRVPHQIKWASWFDANRILVATDGLTVKVYDLDQTLDQGVIATFQLPNDTKILGSLADHSGFWFQSAAALWTWSWASN